MRQISKGLILAILIIVLSVSGVLAATWEFYFPIIATNNSTTTRTYYPIVTGLNGQSFINSGKINPNGLNTNMQIGSTNAKYMISTTNITTVAPSLPSKGTVTFDLYTGYSPEQTGFPIITGDGGNITSLDYDNVEPFNIWKLEYYGYVNTSNGTSKYLFDKTSGNATSGGVRAYVSENISGNITADVVNAYTPTAGMLSQNDLDAWNAAQLIDGNTATAGFNVDTSLAGAYVRIDFGAGNERTLVAWQFYTNANVYMYNNIQYSDDAAAWTTVYSDYRPYGAGVWSGVYWNNQGAHRYWQGYMFNNGSAGGSVMEMQTWQASPSVSIASIASGNMTVIAQSDGGNCWLTVDTSATTHYGSANVSTQTSPNNTNLIRWLVNNVMSYANAISYSVNGTQQIYYAPNTMLLGTTLPDRSADATSNDGTITWGVNDQIILHYGEMVSSASTEATISTLTGLTLKKVALPAHWYNVGTDLSALPFYDTFNASATESGQPVQLYYFWIAIGLAWTTMILVAGLTKSAFLGATAMCIVLAISSMQGVVSGWIVFACVIMDLIIVYLYRQIAY